MMNSWICEIKIIAGGMYLILREIFTIGLKE